MVCRMYSLGREAPGHAALRVSEEHLQLLRRRRPRSLHLFNPARHGGMEGRKH